MSYDESYTADVQRMAKVHNAGMSGAAHNSEKSLSLLHRDLPELANFTIKYLGESGINVAESKASSHRLTEALMRETALRPQGGMTDLEKYEVSKSALRSVLVQEAAAHEYEARTGKMDTYREFMRDRQTTNGRNAMSRLERQGVDTVALYGPANDMELAQMSVGAFNQTGVKQQERIARALEVAVPEIGGRSAQAPSIAPGTLMQPERSGPPVRGQVSRHPHGDVRRPSPSFGRKASPEMASAGYGI